MRAGRLRDRIRFERMGPSADDGYGNEIDGTWGAFDTSPAEIKPLKGRETVLASKLQGVSPVEIMVRWTPALGKGDDRLTPNDRAVNDRTGEVYNIRAVENLDMRQRWLTITAEAGVAT